MIPITFYAICAVAAVGIANGVDCEDDYWAQPPIEEMTLYATWYNPERCEPGVQCLQGSGDGFFASLVPVSAEWHMNMAACPAEMFGEIVRVNLGGGWDEMFCGDNFGYHPNGDKVLTVFYHKELDTWFARLDVYWSESLMGAEPDWALLYVNEWERVGPAGYTAKQLAEQGKIP